jgi:phage shock protein E
MKDLNLWILIGLGLLAFYLIKRSTLISADRARSLFAEGAQVIDVRSAGEFSSGHLPMAANLPLDEIGRRLPEFIPDRNRVILLHCLSGTRSGIAQVQLRRMGYTRVYNLGSLDRARTLLSPQG